MLTALPVSYRYSLLNIKVMNRDNLPPSLVSLVSIPEMAPAVVNYALGPNGHYWFQYEGENGETVTRKFSYVQNLQFLFI